jgi:hypothetical protein
MLVCRVRNPLRTWCERTEDYLRVHDGTTWPRMEAGLVNWIVWQAVRSPKGPSHGSHPRAATGGTAASTALHGRTA